MSENEHEAKMAHPRMAAGALFFDDADRVLLVEPSYKDYRDIPGGYVEQGESPRQACVREVHEELGIKPHIGRLLVVDWAPNPGEGDKILYLFDGGRLSTDHRHQITLQADELCGYDFHDAEELSGLSIPRLVRRITAGIQARANGLTAYLEHGERPGTDLPRA
ncbi:NUDIX domain-containing protein [Streptomyces sp. CA-132043]|uniref:NUDIX domain-containing protein n=1 Tax=Streptomyces sp. CA-132043 TaxID=3240048 RepID=UPI003D8B99F3